jgi:hypothetical protein
MKFLLPFLLILIFACQSKQAFKKANTYFLNGKFKEASIAYEKIYQANKNELHVKENLAFCYLNLGEFEKSIILYESISKEKISTTAIFYLGLSLIALNEGEKARLLFEKILKDENLNSIIELPISIINSPLSKSKLDFKSFKSLYLELIDNRNEDGSWLNYSLNNELTYLKGDSNLNEIESLVYFTDLGTFRTEKNSAYHSKLQLYCVSKIDGQISAFTYNSKEYSTAQACFTPDNKTMFFISDMPGGEGGFDIYSSSLSAEGWSNPENLGATINSENNELLPFISNDGTFFFASENKNTSILEVYVSFWNGKKWNKPINCNYPLLNEANDFGLNSIRELKQLVISKSFAGKPSQFVFEGILIDSTTQQAIETADLLLLTGKTGEGISIKTNKEGLFSTIVKPTNYEIRISKQGYYSKVGKLNFSDEFNQFLLNADLSKIDFDKNYLLEDLEFDSITYFPTQKSLHSLNRLAYLLIDNPTLEIVLTAFLADSTVIYEKLVLEKKLNVILQFLKSRNININRVTTKIEQTNGSIHSNSFTYRVLKQ